MVAPLQGTLSSSVLFRLINPAMPPVLSADGDFLSGITTQLVSKLNAIDDARRKLTRLAASAEALTGPKGAELFQTRRAASSNAAVVTGTAKTGARFASHTVTVEQIAKAHQIRSDRLDAAATAVTAGSYRFSLTVAGKATEVTVDVKQGETNAAVLQKTAAAINAAGAGVKAEVVAGDTPGTSRLQLTSSATGTDATIALADESGSLLTSLGLTPLGAATATTGGTSVAAQDAKYRLGDGPTLTSHSNDISLAAGQVTLSLKGAGTATVTVGVDADAVGTAIERLVADFNDALGYAQSVGKALPSRVSQSLQGLVTANRSTLATMGIQQGADGSLIFDKTKLEKLIESDPAYVAAAFANGLSGISRQVRTGLSALQQGLTIEAGAASRQLSQAFYHQQLSASYNLLARRQQSYGWLPGLGGVINAWG